MLICNKSSAALRTKPSPMNGLPTVFLRRTPSSGRLASLVDDRRLAGKADIGALRKEFGSLLTLDEWLAGPGRPLLEAALQVERAPVGHR
jgi:hypothetical protein